MGNHYLCVLYISADITGMLILLRESSKYNNNNYGYIALFFHIKFNILLLYVYIGNVISLELAIYYIHWHSAMLPYETMQSDFSLV